MLFRRMELLFEGKSAAAALFSGPYYFAEQLGYRKIIDTTFMIAAMINGDPEPEDIRRYFRALRKAQRDIDLRPELYTHYYINEFPERFHAMMDTRRWGPGERIVFEPYARGPNCCGTSRHPLASRAAHTATEKVFTFHATGLNPNDYYASVGSLHAFGEVNPTTGEFTPLLSADNVPGFNFSSPHGFSFTADTRQMAVHDNDQPPQSNTVESQNDVLPNTPDNFVFRDGFKSAADTSPHSQPHNIVPQFDHGLLNGVAAGETGSALVALLQTHPQAIGHDASVIAPDNGEHINPADLSKQVLLAHASFDFPLVLSSCPAR